MRQPALVELRFIPAGSAVVERLFPGLDRAGDAPEELVVISDQGGVYRDGSAWIMCLFALEAYRDWANRLAHPLLRPFARQAFVLLSKQRSRISRWLSLASEVEIAETLSQVNAPVCVPQAPASAEKPRPEAHRSSPVTQGAAATENDDAITAREPFARPCGPH
jgi:hypothetical protein